MYCTNCGKNLKGEKFCTNCGKKAQTSFTTEPQNTGTTIKSSTAYKTTIHYKSRKSVFAVVAVVVVFVSVIFVLTEGKSGHTYSTPYVNNPYGNSQGIIVPPVDFPNSLADDSYDYNSSTRICPSCHGTGSCPICNGTGQYSMYGNELSECPACGGTGSCSVCGGEGSY